jgi:DNA-binding transcriptional ArsR family regulator
MVKYESDVLDAVFAALAHPTRRKVLQTLEQGSSSVGELAEPQACLCRSSMKHLRVLEDAGLVTRKDGRVVNLVISPEPMHEAAVWLSRYDKFWSERLGALGRYLYQEEELNPPWKTAAPKTALRSPSLDTTTSRRKKSGVRGRTRKR